MEKTLKTIDEQIERIREFASVRAQAMAAHKPHAVALRTAVLTAEGAGASRADIAHAAAVAVTRQAVHLLLNRNEQSAHQAWEAAGRPDPESAVQSVADIAPSYRDLQSAVTAATDNLVRQMGYAQAEGARASAIVAASGMAEQAGYDYLATLRLLTDVRAVLAASGMDELILVSRRGTRVIITGGAATVDDGRTVKEARRICAAAVDMITSAGYAVTGDPWDQWCPVRRAS